MSFSIEKATAGYDDVLLRLYKVVAEFPDGIIRKNDEITSDYIESFYSKSLKKGLMFFAKKDGMIIGEIHAYTPDILAFQHILTDLTIVIHPDFQGRGVGRKLFKAFLQEVSERLKHILRIELYTREHNSRNVAFYESLGFINEGRQKHKIFLSPNKL
nr:GNAT family N-acetyltransferase [uncultured Allomuricauda sp.]